MSSTATETYQQSVQNLQAWIDHLTSERERVQNQLNKMQGGGSALPLIDADIPYVGEEDSPLPAFLDDADDKEESISDKWQ